MSTEAQPILITGGRGQLAGALGEALAARYKVVSPGRDDMDVTDSEAVRSYIDSLQPGLVLHTAAATDVDGCESEKPRAYQVNVLGSENVATTCAKADVPLIALSTDYVFDGSASEPYSETAEPNPINVYGRSKLEGEERIMTTYPTATVVRTSWLYGGTKRSFVASVLEQVDSGAKELRVVKDQVGSPTWIGNLAEQIACLAETPLPGIVHAAAHGAVSWYEFTVALLEELSIDMPVRPISTPELNRPAPRPQYSALANSRLAAAELDAMPDWREGLKQFASQYKAAKVSS